MDDTDMATMREELARTAAIALIANEASKPLPKSKKCLECGLKTNGKRWCDSDCETTYNQRKRFNRGL